MLCVNDILVAMYGDISRAGDCDVSIALTQVDSIPDLHLRVLTAVEAENGNGARSRPQTTSRQVGVLLGLTGPCQEAEENGNDDEVAQDLHVHSVKARWTVKEER